MLIVKIEELLQSLRENKYLYKAVVIVRFFLLYAVPQISFRTALPETRPNNVHPLRLDEI